MHTSTEQLAEISNEINLGLLVITHLLLWGRSEAELVEEVAQGYNGVVVCAVDLDILVLDEDGCSYANLLKTGVITD